jgi:hypothetical protein
VPEYIRQYVVPDGAMPDFYRIGKGWEKPNGWLYFEIPGLAKILFAPQAKESPWKYQTANPYEQKYGYDGDVIHHEPSLEFHDRSYGWTDDLDYALGRAQAEFQKYQEYVEEYAAKQEEIAKADEQREALAQAREVRDAEAAAQREREQAEEKAEEQALFDAIKNDPVAINLLKAFLMINQERSVFQERLEDYDQTMYSMEERWSRRAEDLHRQADEAQRKADEERDRASSLQYDLEDAEKKLKKSERGW